MTEPENFEDDLFADLYEDNEASRNAPAPPKPAPTTAAPANNVENIVQNDTNDGDAQMKHGDHADAGADDEDNDVDFNLGADSNTVTHVSGGQDDDADSSGGYGSNRAASKEEGKMFIGGLNWETTDESLKDYFSQFGEVVECTVMRDSATGRSRGFGFLTFKDAKTVNIVMVKEHFLDGKIIDPKRAIPRDEQEKTSKIFVGGVSQDTTDQEFRDYFAQFGRVVDATLMMDKDTGRPRGFGFVTFESEAGVDACINVPLEIHGKPIEVKKAQPRGNLREEEEASKKNKFGRHEQNQGGMNQAASNNGMTPQAMAQYFQRMQQYFAVMQQQMAMRGGMQMNPAMWQNMMQMQQMQQMMGRGGGQGGAGMMNNMNPQMMQQMQQMQQQMMQQQQQGGQGQGGEQGFDGGNNYNQFQQGGGRRGGRGGYNQGFGRGGAGQNQMQQGGAAAGGGQSSYEGMYDDPQPGGSRPGSAFGSSDGQNAPPANAPTGPKNAGRPGANYRGGGRGGNRGFHPYAR